MNPSNRPTLARAPVRQDSLPASAQSVTTALDRQDSLSSESSSSSRVTALSASRPSPTPYAQPNQAAAASAALGVTFQRPARKVTYDTTPRADSPLNAQTDFKSQRAKYHSQGFFEPSLPTASYSSSPSMAGLSASQIAAQAAMQVQGNFHARRRSQTVPDPLALNQQTGKRKPSYPTSQSSNDGSRASSQSRSGLQPSPSNLTAATAASAAYPRSPIPSPVLQQSEYVASPTNLEKEQKPSKEKSRMKIFSKPKSINVSGHKDQDKKVAPSPKKPGIYSSSTLPRSFNHSTTSLVDPPSSSASSLYSNSNASASTLVPADKDKHRHNFLSRQKHKINNANEYPNLPLSSAASNSRPTDPNTQPLYSFAPSSPAPSATFNKSKTGLDLRHGGRALREKKREEKAAAGTFVPPITTAGSSSFEAASRDREHHGASTPDWMGPAPTIFGPPSASTTNMPESATLQQTLGAFGLPNMTLDDAWPLLKARLLIIFEGEDIRTPIEDFNRLVTAHLQRCVQQRTPDVIIEDLRELVNTGFNSLDQAIRRAPEYRLIPSLVDTWAYVFGTVLPFFQAVFHPLDLELKGRGTILSRKDAADFWSGLSLSSISNAGANSANMPSGKAGSTVGGLIDVRSLVLKTFRDVSILPRHDLLLSVFSRLSLDNINAVPLDRLESPPLLRPGTAASTNSGGPADLPNASFNSQGSTLLDSSVTGSLGARSRATSNTSAMSAGSFQSMSSSRPHASSQGSSTAQSRSYAQQQAHQGMPPPQLMDSAKVTQTAARMLQCVSVLAGLQIAAPGASIDAQSDGTDGETLARRKMERLGKELKLNWLGRGRTGRNRRGFIGSKVRSPPTVGAAA